MKAYVFPGQGSQFSGMGKDLYENSPVAKELFDKADEILGFKISEIMFNGTDEELKQTKVTQPAVFLHSVILAKAMGDNFQPDMVAGHSLGELSALTAAGAISFEDGLKIVAKRAMAMQKACEIQPSIMAAILGLEEVYAPAKDGINGVELANAMHLSSWLGKEVTLPIDGELFYEELKKRIAISKPHKVVEKTEIQG